MKQYLSLLIGLILSVIVFLLSKIELQINRGYYVEYFNIDNLWCSYIIVAILLISSIIYIVHNNIKFKGGFLSYGLIFSFFAYIFLVIMMHEHVDIYPLAKENINLLLFINIITISVHFIDRKKNKTNIVYGNYYFNCYFFANDIRTYWL